VFLHELANKPSSCWHVPFGLKENIKSFSFSINNPQRHICVPRLRTSVSYRCHRLRGLGRRVRTQPACHYRSERVDPAPDGLIRDRDSTLAQEFLDTAEREGQVESVRTLDNVRWNAEAGVER
jgi:hypothetical protein